MEDRRKNPPTMNEDQLAFFTEQTERAARKASRRTLRGAMVGYLILFAGISGMYCNGQSVSRSERGAVVESGRAVAIHGCNRDYQTIAVLRGVLTAGREVQVQAYASREISQSQFRRALAFYAEQLRLLEFPDCREADHLIDDDPARKIRVPSPLHPGG